MTSLLALLSIMSTAFSGSGDSDSQVSSDTTDAQNADEVAPSQSMVPDWVSVLDTLATKPVDDIMPDMAEDDDTEELFLL